MKKGFMVLILRTSLLTAANDRFGNQLRTKHPES